MGEGGVGDAALHLPRGNLASLLAVYGPGETIELHAFRDELLTFSVKLQAPPADSRALCLPDGIAGAGRAQRAACLGAE